MRVHRGGSWVASPQQARCAMRGLLPRIIRPGDPNPWIGFRLVAEVAEARPR
jgi:formylglycine-generating enzyme required for sulfatase activity